MLFFDVKKSSGPDGVSAIMLKTCDPDVTWVLTRLFSLSYDTGSKVPSSWKVAKVHSITKKGDSIDPSYYRPIVITSPLSTVMNPIINTQLLGHLQDNRLMVFATNVAKVASCLLGLGIQVVVQFYARNLCLSTLACPKAQCHQQHCSFCISTTCSEPLTFSAMQMTIPVTLITWAELIILVNK